MATPPPAKGTVATTSGETLRGTHLRFVIRRILLAVLTLISDFDDDVRRARRPSEPRHLDVWACLSEAQQAVINKNLGLTSWHIQYANYVKGTFAGRQVGEGESVLRLPGPCSACPSDPRAGARHPHAWTRSPRASCRAPSSIVVGIGTGMVAAIRRGSALDKACGFSPTRLDADYFCLVLLYFLVYQWKILPNPEYVVRSRASADGWRAWRCPG
jgi:peptide/nickel transport system permease protein